ncbi:hypothetical protein FRC08_015998, partial [Ceratobasidium sp. 394]
LQGPDLLWLVVLLPHWRHRPCHPLCHLAQVPQLVCQVYQFPGHLQRNWFDPPCVCDQLCSLGDCWVHLPVRYPQETFPVVGQVQLRLVRRSRLGRRHLNRHHLLLPSVSQERHDRQRKRPRLVGQRRLHQYRRRQGCSPPCPRARRDVWSVVVV